MDDVRNNQEMASPRPARAKRLERALVAQYIHDLSERHRPRTPSAKAKTDGMTMAARTARFSENSPGSTC
jgi:hypothetical protein